MSRISYLFGAGASCNSLPIVTKIPERYKEFRGTVRNLIFDKHKREPIDPGANQYQDEIFWESLLFKTLGDFEEGIITHSSVDTYAKKLFLTASKDTQYLYKLSLSSFFAFEQIVKGPDKRYDTFFASILKEKVNDLPDNMSILSWNYDNQFEIAYSSYSKHDELQRARDAIRIVTKSDNSSFNHPSDKFHIIKLNGTTALLGPGGNSSFFLHDKCFDRAREFSYDDLMMITNSFKRYVTNTEMMPSLSFAWEQNVDYQYSILFKAVGSVEHITTLVIIGYSFPFFNRRIDRGIFDSMRALTKIYIQDPRANDIVQRVEELCIRKARQKKVEIVPYTDTSQFLIPNELD